MRKFVSSCAVLSFAVTSAVTSAQASSSPAYTFEPLVESTPESLLSAYELSQSQNPGNPFSGGNGYHSSPAERISQFLGCFVSNMDLPAQVYMSCGVSIVNVAKNCDESIMQPGCMAAAMDMAKKCYAPVMKAVQAVKFCSAVPGEDTPVPPTPTEPTEPPMPTDPTLPTEPSQPMDLM